MWADSRAALEDLQLSSRHHILDVGCGTGELTGVLASEAAAGDESDSPITGGSDGDRDGPKPATTDVEIVGVDADESLLSIARDRWRDESAPVPATFVRADGRTLPFVDGSFDLVVCQALLSNLQTPASTLDEFRRLSSDLVAAIEPDNAAVGVSSTIDAEESLEQRVREAYMDGIDTDVAIATSLPELFEETGLEDVTVRRYLHEKRIEPPYSETAIEGAAKKASGAGIAEHEREIRQAIGKNEYDNLVSAWREMGRTVVSQMQANEYERVEIVPFSVTVGRVPRK